MTKAQFELAIERHIDAPPQTVFKVWTERLGSWWAPRPWTTRVIALDLRPGGRMAMAMSGPGGETSPMEGVFLEIAPDERIVFTNAFTAGWIPQTPFMVGFFTFAPEGRGTLYRAGARHWDEAGQRRHEAMGFIEGWTTVAGQLAALAEAEGRSIIQGPRP